MNKIMNRILCVSTAFMLSVGAFAPDVHADTDMNSSIIEQEFSDVLEEIKNNPESSGESNFRNSESSLEPSVVGSDSFSEAVRTLCNYIDRNGTETEKLGKEIHFYLPEALGTIAYDKDRGIFRFGLMLSNENLGYPMVTFNYDISSEEVENNVGFYIKRSTIINGEKFIAATPFSTGYRDREKMSARVMKGIDFTEDQIEEVLPSAFSAGMRFWNKMIEKVTDGRYNIGNLGFTNYIAAKSDTGTVNKSGFSDVSDDMYYSEPVIWAVQNNITTGTSKTTFDPASPCTRGQIVTFLYKAYGNGEISQVSAFSDVKPGAYYYNAVNWAVAKGITSGTGNGKFSPNAPCTRGQAMTFLYKAKKSPASQAGTVHFTDVSPNQYYYDAVNWAVSNNITSGTSQTTFSPNNVCSRAQIVTFLYKANQSAG